MIVERVKNIMNLIRVNLPNVYYGNTYGFQFVGNRYLYIEWRKQIYCN